MSGENTSEPKEYKVKKNVEEKVINDIFNFIKKN